MSYLNRLILMNMMENGMIDIGDNDMAIYTTMNKDYTIELSRSDVKLWNEVGSFKYLCKFIFKNNMGIPVLELVTSEVDISGFLESVYNFLEFGSPDLIFPFNTNSNFKSFNFNFVRDLRFVNDNTLYISQYDPIYKTMVNRIKIDFDEEHLSNFLNMIYFIFLIDIDEFIMNKPDFLL